MSQPPPLLPVLLSLPFLVFWAWMAWHMTKNGRLSEGEKTIWAMAFVVLNIFAAIYYYVTEYRR